MADTQNTPTYLQVTPENVASLAHKLEQFTQSLSPAERELLMERIKRSMPLSDLKATAPLAATPAVFAGWLNSIVSDVSRWYPQ